MSVPDFCVPDFLKMDYMNLTDDELVHYALTYSSDPLTLELAKKLLGHMLVEDEISMTFYDTLSSTYIDNVIKEYTKEKDLSAIVKQLSSYCELCYSSKVGFFFDYIYAKIDFYRVARLVINRRQQCNQKND